MYLRSILMVLVFSVCQLLSAQNTVSIIPVPAKLVMAEGNFLINSSTSIKYNASNKALATTANYFSTIIQKRSGITLPINKVSASSIEFSIDKNISTKEAYQLVVKPTLITIKAGSETGI